MWWRISAVLGSVIVLLFIIGFGINLVTERESEKSAKAASVMLSGFKIEYPFLPPGMDKVPEGPEGDLIRQGYKQHNETYIALPQYAKGTLSCTSCHANGGVGSSLDLVGVAKTYPQYNARAGKVMTLEDRINGCFMRSMNGNPLPKDSVEMKAFIAYYTYISQNVPDGTKERPWAKLKKAEGDMSKIDIKEGKELYTQTCIACHGEDGNGQRENGLALWGDNSFNVGAGMNRLRTAAGFIKEFMPRVPIRGVTPGSVTEEEALNIAAYIQSMKRPDFPDKMYDWPNGDAPDDAAYETLAGDGKTGKY